MNNTQVHDPIGVTARRDFLKYSAATAAAALSAMPGFVKHAHAGGSDIIRVGMIGCGPRCAGAAAEALKADPGARLVAMCDIIKSRLDEKRNRLKQQFKDQVIVDDDHCFLGFEGYKHVIDASDVVLIANAAKFHPYYALCALRAGKHVFVEKPHGIDPLGIKVLTEAAAVAQEKGLSLVSGLQSRYHTGYRETIERIHDGAIGDIISLEEVYLRPPYQITQREPWMSEIEWQCSTQYHFNWLSGDDIPQSLVHNLDRSNWVLGNTPPVKCHGMGGRSSMTDPIYGNVFDHHSVVYEYENGVRIYAFCRTTEGCYNEVSSTVYGSKGRASIMSCEIMGENPWKWEKDCDPYQIEHDVLFNAIRKGVPVNNGDFMARSTMMGIMGQISCYTGEEITWERVNNADFSFGPKPEDCHDAMDAPVLPDESGSYPVYRPGFTRLLAS